MVDQAKSDLVMKFTDKDGGPIWAESVLSKAADDGFMADFKPADSYADYSNFFEISNFSFNMAVKPQDNAVGAMTKQQQNVSQRSTAQQDGFFRWRSAKPDEYKFIKYPIEFNVFNFTRVIDAASPLFFSSCCNQVSFYDAVLVKRYEAGLKGGANREGRGFLRIDFRDVLLTGINWDDGDLVTETCTFICKHMEVTYRQQNVDGSLQTSLPPAVWDQKKSADAAGQQGTGE